MRYNESGSVELTVLTGVFISGIVAVSFFFPWYLEIMRYIVQYLPGTAYEVKTASKNLPVSTESVESLNSFEIAELRQMLQDGRFDQLNAVLADYQARFETDQANEYWLYDAYETFFITLPSFEALLEMWIKATPDRYQPYLAAAKYYYAKGWECRGQKWARETSREQFQEMRRLFGKAEEHIETALGIKPNLMIAYDTLIGIYNARGEDRLEDQTIQRASELFPRSFMIRASISWTKTPRWGGSYARMETLAKAAEAFSGQNPKMAVLYGFIYSDQARIFERNKRYRSALKMLDKALRFGEHGGFYKQRAKIYYYDLRAFDKALADVNRSIRLRPALYENHLLRSKVNFATAEWAEALDDIETAERLKPGHPDIRKWRGWASNNVMNRGHRVFKTNLGLARDYYSLAVEFDPGHAKAYYWRGRAAVGLKDLTSALPDFLTAVDLDPQDFESCRMIDYSYAQERQWDKIIGCWDRFLSLSPDHAGAYYERAGAHYHNNDAEAALRDLKKACDLGSKPACAKYATVRSRN